MTSIEALVPGPVLKDIDFAALGLARLESPVRRLVAVRAVGSAWSRQLSEVGRAGLLGASALSRTDLVGIRLDAVLGLSRGAAMSSAVSGGLSVVPVTEEDS